MDVEKRALKRRMDKVRRPLQLERLRDENGITPGGCLLGNQFNRFMILDPREKLLVIRLWLEEMYGSEYSRASIGDGKILSYQGLKNIEEMLRNSVRDSNIAILAKKYHVPHGVIAGKIPKAEWANGLFIGKPEDRDNYFYRFYIQQGQNHILDDSDYSKAFWEEATKELKEVDIEVYIKVRHPETGEPITSRNIARLKVLSNEVPRLHEIILKDMEMVAYKHNEYMSMREQMSELYRRLEVAESRIDMYEGIDPNDTLKTQLDELLNN